MSYYHQPVQQAPYDPEIIYIVNSPNFKNWHQHHSQFFHFESVYEAAVVFFLEGLPDVVSQLTGDLHSCMYFRFAKLRHHIVVLTLEY